MFPEETGPVILCITWTLADVFFFIEMHVMVLHELHMIKAGGDFSLLSGLLKAKGG